MYKDESLRMRVACIIFLQLTDIFLVFFVTQLIKYFRIIQMDSRWLSLRFAEFFQYYQQQPLLEKKNSLEYLK